jgi:hypothetical protein
VTHALVALHATDPSSVYLSVLARSARSTLADVSAAMYERRALVRWMAMQRTLFVLPRTDVPVVQAAVSTPLAAVLRQRLISQLKRNGTEPPVSGDLETWLSSRGRSSTPCVPGAAPQGPSWPSTSRRCGPSSRPARPRTARRRSPPPEVSRWLGHKSITTTVDLYGHLVPEASGRARDALDRAFTRR